MSIADDVIRSVAFCSCSGSLVGEGGGPLPDSSSDWCLIGREATCISTRARIRTVFYLTIQ